MQSLLQAAVLVPASIPSPDWSGFDIPLPWGTLRIHAYALCILAGIVAGLWLTSVRWAKRGAPEGSVWDIVVWAIPFGIIGGRLYHVFSSPDAYFGPGFDGTGDLSLIPQIQRGGLGTSSPSNRRPTSSHRLSNVSRRSSGRDWSEAQAPICESRPRVAK